MAKRGQGEGTISKREDGTWWARITLGKDENGKQKRKAFYGKTRREVQEKLTAAVNDVNNDVYIEPSKLTVEQWVTTWLNTYKKHSVRPTTYWRYHQCICYDINPFLGRYKISEIGFDTVQKFINYMNEEKKYSHSSISASVSVLKMALEQAVKNGILTKNVAAGSILPKKKKTVREVLTKEEQDKFIEHVSNLYYGRFYILLLSTGLRNGEARALTWRDIDFDKVNLSLSKTHVYTKNPDNVDGKRISAFNPPKTTAGNRIIPLLPNVIEMLKAHRKRQLARNIPCEEDNLVFTTCHNTPILKESVYTDFKRQINRLGFNERLTMHCLRHTFATRGLENGVEMRVMQDLLGHSSIKMTADLYTHVLEDTKKDSIKMMESTIKLSYEDFVTGDDLVSEVKDYLDKNKMSSRQFAKEIGYAYSSLQSYLTKNVKMPDAIEGAIRKYFTIIKSRNGE